MKNKLVAGGLALLTAFALVACTTPNPSENGPSETSQQEGSSSYGGNSGESNSGTGSSSSETQVTDWTDAQKAVMTSHLGGRVLPFMSIPEVTVTWYDEWACVSIESKKATEADTNAYRGILTNDGYVFTYNESYGFWDAVKTFSNFDKIEIQIYYDAGFNCDVYLQTADTSWPTTTISTLLGATTNTVPAYQSSYYYVYDTAAESGYITIVALNQTIDSEAAYTTVLTTAGWTVFNQKYATNGLIARDSANQIEINFAFKDNTLEIYIFKAVGTYSSEWPSASLATFIADANSVATIPSFDSTFFLSGTANFNDADNVAREWFYVAVLGSDMTVANTEDAYKTLLTNNGYIIDSSKYATEGYYATSSDEKIYINFVFDANNNQFMIYVIGVNKLHGIEESILWPYEKVAAFVNNVEISVPEFPSDVFKTSVSESSVIVRVKVQNMQSAESDYIGVLTSIGWTVDSTGTNPVAINAGIDDSTIQLTVSTSQLTATSDQYLIITIEKYVKPLAAGAFVFTNTDQLTSSSADVAVWTSRTVTMTIEKNTATLAVGGDGSGFLSDPLRVYTGHKMTFNAGTAIIGQIVITCSSSKYASALASSTWTNGTAVVSGSTVTVTASSGVSIVSVVLGAQTRMTDATVGMVK